MFLVEKSLRSVRLENQGQILAVWILAAKLPNSALSFAVGFGSDISFCFVQGKGPPKKHQKFSRKIRPEICSDKFPSDVCRGLILTEKICILQSLLATPPWWAVIASDLRFVTRLGVVLPTLLWSRSWCGSVLHDLIRTD